MIETLLQDVRLAVRALKRTPGFALAVILTLALGMGGNATIFTALRASLFAGIPYPQPDRLVALDLTITGKDGRTEPMTNWSYPKFETMRSGLTTLDLVAARTGREVTLLGGTEPVRAYLEAATPDYFPLFGASASLGRLYTRPEDLPGVDAQIAVLAYTTWVRLFGGDSSLVGRTVRINGAPVVVIGVMRPGFRGVSGNVDVWVPTRALPGLGYTGVLERRWAHGFVVFGRVREGGRFEQVRAEMAVLGRRVDEAHPDPEGAGAWGATAVRLTDVRTNAGAVNMVLILEVAVALVLLLASVNVVNMLLARAATRERELVIRAALGAGRARLIGYLLTESVILAGIGGLVGLAIAFWGVDLLRSVMPASWGDHGTLFLDPQKIRLDVSALVFTAAVALVTGIVIGLAPAWQFSRAQASPTLREGTGTVRGLGSLRKPTLRGGLVVAEVALAIVLLAGAGLMIRTLGNLASVRPGFEPEGVLAFRYRLPPNDTRASDPAFHERALERFGSLPGVQAAALSDCPPLGGCYDYNSVTQISGQPPIAPAEQPMVRTHYVSEAFFLTLGVPVLAGRTFDPRDRVGSPPVMVLSRAAAKKLFGDGPVLGQFLSVSINLTANNRMAQVIGVVGDVHHQRLQEEPVADIYVSLRQSPFDAPVVFLRTAGDPLALVAPARAILRDLASDAPIEGISTMPQLVAAATKGERLVTWSLGGFAALALVLAAIGVYGVVAYSVTQRQREVAVRLALGAEPRRVLGLLLGEGMTLVGAGAAMGVIAALVISTALTRLLFGVPPRDPVTITAIVLLLLGVASAAIFIPARRAARLDPMVALRTE